MVVSTPPEKRAIDLLLLLLGENCLETIVAEIQTNAHE